MTGITHVRLLTQRIPIRVVEKLHFEDVSAYGAYSHDEPAIELDANLSFERERETLVHESLHAMLALTGDAFLEPADEENLVTFLSPVVLSWLRDNPSLIRYVQESQA